MQIVTRCARRATRTVLGRTSLAYEKSRKHRQVRHAVRQNLRDGGDGHVDVKSLTGWDVA